MQFFDRAGALERLAPFAAHHGADFYGLPRPTATVSLERRPWTVPASEPFAAPGSPAGEDIVPFWAGRELDWRLVPGEPVA